MKGDNAAATIITKEGYLLYRQLFLTGVPCVYYLPTYQPCPGLCFFPSRRRLCLFCWLSCTDIPNGARGGERTWVGREPARRQEAPERARHAVIDVGRQQEIGERNSIGDEKTEFIEGIRRVLFLLLFFSSLGLSGSPCQTSDMLSAACIKTATSISHPTYLCLRVYFPLG